MLPSESPIPEGFPVVGCPSCDGARYRPRCRLLPTDGLTYACAMGREVSVEEFQRLLDQGRIDEEDARMEAEREAAIGRFREKVTPPEPPGVIDAQEAQKSLEVLVSGTPAEVTAEWDRLAVAQDRREDAICEKLNKLPRGKLRGEPDREAPLLRKHQPSIHLQSVSDLLLEDREPHSLPGADAFDSGHRDTAERAEEMLAGGEVSYSAGRRMAYVQMLRFALRGLKIDDPEATGARWVIERAELLNVLRDACSRSGDNDWPDDLHLGDALEKHLLRYLEE